MGYSQFGEEEKILEFFHSRPGHGRRFLDVGAHDGISCSNSRRLAELGWGGTLVEPSPAVFQKLLQLYGDQPNIKLVNAGMVTGLTRMLKFYETGGSFVGTFDEKHRQEWEGVQHVHFIEMFIVGASWSTLFEALPGPYQFVSIDVEGTNFDLFKELVAYSNGFEGGLNLNKTELVCVEHQGRVDEIVALAEPQGFSLFHQTEANVLLARKE